MSDTTGQAINNTLGTLMTNTTGQAINTTLQSLVGAISPSADNVSFDNTGTGLSASDVQNAIAEVNDGKSLAFTPTSGITVNYSSLGIQGQLMYGNIEAVVTVLANTLTTIGSLSVAPSNKLTAPTLRVNGTYTGMIWINTDKSVQIFSTQALSSNAISFQFVGKKA